MDKSLPQSTDVVFRLKCYKQIFSLFDEISNESIIFILIELKIPVPGVTVQEYLKDLVLKVTK